MGKVIETSSQPIMLGMMAHASFVGSINRRI
jgi:hypothetical protein